MSARRSSTRAGLGLLAIAVVGSLLAVVGPAAAVDDPASVLYPGNPEAESALVAREDRRIIDVRSTASSAQWSDIDAGSPYRLRTGTRNTLVLVARSEQYTLPELAALAPESVSPVDAGETFLVIEHVVVLDGATLSVEPGQTALLASDSSGFSTLITLGGTLLVAGSATAPAFISSWDVAAGAPDRDTSDGRAYVRIFGGHAAIGFAFVDALGFWSGNTGGLSLTGTELPDDDVVPVGADSVPDDGAAPLVTPGKSETVTVTAEIRQVTVTGNAFGIFVTNASGVSIVESVVHDSLVDGVVFHRYVSDSSLRDVESSGNAVDGVVVSRASSDLTFDDVTASQNGRNGITIDGSALVDGPNAVGVGTHRYGDIRVTGGSAVDNARYGIEVIGGEGIALSGTSVSGGEVGVVVRDGATEVAISDLTVMDAERQGISVRDDVAAATIEDNIIQDVPTGIYVRNAHADVRDNTVTGAAVHGITLVGDLSGTEVTGNDLAGNGSIAIDSERSLDAVVERNQVDGWVQSLTVQRLAGLVFQPLTIVWLGIAALVVLALFARRSARRGDIIDPFIEHKRLGDYSRGIVDRATAAEWRT